MNGPYRLERIDRGEIRSEVTRTRDGQGVHVQVDAGQAFGASLAAVFTIAPDMSRVPVEASVGEPDVGRVAAGEVATLRCPAYPGTVLTGTVAEVLPTPGMAQGHTVVIEADDDRDHRLLPGMAASVTIELARREGVLRLPLRAVDFTPPGVEGAAPATPPAGRVFVLDHGRPRPVRVTVGLQDQLHVRAGGRSAGRRRRGDRGPGLIAAARRNWRARDYLVAGVAPAGRAAGPVGRRKGT